MFYPHAAAEVLALDILHDAGGQHVTATSWNTTSADGRTPVRLRVLALSGRGESIDRPGVPVPAALASYDADLI